MHETALGIRNKSKEITRGLPDHVREDRFITSAILAISDSRDLQQCDKKSVFAILDPDQRSIVFANAGHPWPLFVNSAAARLLKHAADPSTSAQSVLDDVSAFIGGRPSSDDITVVKIEARE